MTQGPMRKQKTVYFKPWAPSRLILFGKKNYANQRKSEIKTSQAWSKGPSNTIKETMQGKKIQKQIKSNAKEFARKCT